jgi:predicted metal-binding protein
MRNVAVVGCGAYMNSGYGCPGEWRCLKAASLGEGTFGTASSVVAFITCECPGRTVVPNLGMAMKLSQIKPEVIHFSSCLAKANPKCPYTGAEELAKIVENATGIKVVLGTHDYH